VFFHDDDDPNDVLDMDDIFDSDMDTGESMVAMPRNWTDLTLDDVNDGKSLILDLKAYIIHVRLEKIGAWGIGATGLIVRIYEGRTFPFGS